MQALLSRFLPFILLLFFFSCAKDNDLTPLPEQALQQKILQAKGKPCKDPCRKPDWINMDKVESCSAVLSWGHNKKVCGTYTIQLYNHSTGEWTYYNSVTSPFTLTGLDPCTQYTVGVSHITDKCASIPLKISFQTDCKACKNSCDIPCEPLDYFSIDNISADGATINFGHTPTICGTFTAQLKNNQTGVITYHYFVTSPWVLTDLDPCTSYSIGISHVTDNNACIPFKKTFSTECSEYCDASGEDPSCLNIDYIQLDYTVSEDTIWCENNEVDGYLDKTDEVLHFNPGGTQLLTVVKVCFCQNMSSFYYFHLWIDLDEDGEFEASELISDATYFTVNLGGTIHCESDLFAGLPIPGNACGLTARLILSTEEDQEPCGEFPIGQVVDFTVSSIDCIP